MKKFNNFAALKAGSAPMVLGLALIASPAYAQDADSSDTTDQENAVQIADPAEQAGQGIVVTGSRIVRRDLESAAPVAVIQDEEFKLSGTVNVENVINTLPQVVPGTTSFSNNPGGGVATLNLRGLGSVRTLVLVNSRRWMFYDTQQLTDLNTIPSFLIDSVDVVTGGASAVYGSDAISGVVNFRLRDDLVGVEAGAQYNITERGDGARYNAFIAMGADLGGGEGHATVFAEYYNRKQIFQGARSFSNVVLGEARNNAGDLISDQFQPGGSSTLPQGRFNTPNTGIIRPGFDVNGDGKIDQNDPLEKTLTANLGTGGVFDDAVFDVAGSPRARNGDLYNYGPANYLQVPQERYLLGGYADYDIGGGHTPYIEATFVNNRVPNELAATPVTGTFNINIAAVSPFLSAAAIADLRRIDANETAINAQRAAYDAALGYCGPGQVVPAGGRPCLGGPLFSGANAPANGTGVISTFVQRRVTDLGSRNSLDERNAFRILAGIKGPITDRFSYDAYYMYARTRNANVQSGNVSRSAFQAGLDGSAPAINIFGPNTLSQASVDQISILAQNGDTSILQVASAAISGTLFNFGMGADDVGLAFGAEYRKVGSEFIPDTALSSGDVIGFNGGLPTEGSYTVREGFAEIRVPIAARTPGLYKLEVNGAARYSDYSLGNVGGVWTYAAGAEYAPVRDITFRGQYQRAVRAPNVGELFGGQSQGFPGATDPCSTPSANTDLALCLATGVSPGALGTKGLQLNTQIQGLFGGNPNLQEEISDSYTAGVVLRPTFLPGFSASVDFYNIKVKGAIDTLGGGLNNTLNLCYNVIKDINSIYCQVIAAARNRAAGGVLDDTNPPQILNANTGKLEVEGVDLQFDYGTRLPLSLFSDTSESRLNFFFLGTYTRKSNLTPVQDLPEEINECAGRFGVLACGEPTPKYKWTSRLSLIDGPVTTSLRWRHLSSVRDDDDDTEYLTERVPAYDLFDLSFAFDITDNFSMAAGVNNLLDKKPFTIGDNQEQANTYPSTYDVLGRDFFVSAKIIF